ncbi:hypothetical protein F4808DRAFT_213669 [Astrocystis sublimbata]|nr:hypothetical protein F4808DRAFT_213669 [Astrocystis sublimbata]
MYTPKALLFLAAALMGSASQASASVPKSDTPACTSALSHFLEFAETEAPATPSAIAAFIAAHTDEIPAFTIGDAESHQSQLCAAAAVLPESLLPPFASLGEELMVFAHSRSSEFVDYISACADDAVVASSVSYFDHVLSATGNICTETATATGTGEVTATASPGCGASKGAGSYPTPTPTTLATRYAASY